MIFKAVIATKQTSVFCGRQLLKSLREWLITPNFTPRKDKTCTKLRVISPTLRPAACQRDPAFYRHCLTCMKFPYQNVRKTIWLFFFMHINLFFIRGALRHQARYVEWGCAVRGGGRYVGGKIEVTIITRHSDKPRHTGGLWHVNRPLGHFLAFVHIFAYSVSLC